jgi:hypothetical protein
MPTQIFFVSMDPLVCPFLNLAVYVEMFGTQGKYFDWKSTHSFSEYLEKLFACFRFKAVRVGRLETPSLCKGTLTYTSRFGLLSD